MRRKKLANKIVSILMAGLMVASTPMSALATDVELTDGIQQIEVQSASEDGETPVEEDADLEEAYVNYTQADLLYQASLQATGKILGTSLLNFI